VARDLLVRRDHHQRAFLLLPPAVLGEGALEGRFGLDALREERAAVGDVDVGLVQLVDVGFPCRPKRDP
jgi:hypothetical protein